MHLPFLNRDEELRRLRSGLSASRGGLAILAVFLKRPVAHGRDPRIHGPRRVLAALP
jgi:hypothetical protein